MACPNVNSPEWQKLVGKIGIYQAFTEFIRNGETIPSADNYEQTIKGVNAALKISEAIIRSPRSQYTTDKAIGYFNDLKKFGAPQVQIDLLKDYISKNGITTATKGDLLAAIASEMSYTIEVRLSEDLKTERTTIYGDFADIFFEANGSRYTGGQSVSFEGDPMDMQYFKDGKSISEEEFFEAQKTAQKIPTRIYEKMSVPGGTNYRENEIRTPGIIPAITGHAQFATKEGIGWFRSDEMEVRVKDESVPDWDHPTYNIIGSKTRRILELQSDLFQKGRDNKDLVSKAKPSGDFINQHEQSFSIDTDEGSTFYTYDEYYLDEGFGPQLKKQYYPKNGQVGREEIITLEEYNAAFERKYGKQTDKEEVKQNDFLQLLNKDNNWVTFFVKAILQDSARKGYEKVMFPSGNTANKIEGQETLENFIKVKQDRLKEIEQMISGEKPQYVEGSISTAISSEDYEKFKQKATEVIQEDDVEVAVGITADDVLNVMPEGLSEFKNLRKIYVRYESTYNGPYIDITFDQEPLDSQRSKLINERDQLSREINDAIAGRTSFAAINRFYEQDVRNILQKQGYSPQKTTDEYGNSWYEIALQPPREESAILFQTESPRLNPTKADPGTIKKIKEFLNRVGVSVEELGSITMDGVNIGINGIADPLNKLIQIAQGREDIALTEEAMHVAVEIIRQKDPVLFKRMFNAIGRYNITQEVINEYGNIKEYQVDGKPNIPKLKTEAIGKILAQSFINLSEKTNERPELLAQTRSWWQAIVDFLKKLFLRAQMNPFEEAAKDILLGNEPGTAADVRTGERFLQIDDDTATKIRLVNSNLARTDDSYELNGEKVRNTVNQEIEKFYKSRLFNMPSSASSKANADFKKETSGKTHEDLIDILSRYIDDNGKVRATPLPQTLPSSINPYDNTFYLTLENHIKDRLSTYSTNTIFFKDVNVHDGINKAGTIDLLAFVDGKVDILQFKIPDLTGKKEDIPAYHQEAYDTEIEALRGILERGYGIKRTDFRLTRAIPIRAYFQYNIPGDSSTGLKLANMTIGKTNARIIEDDVLLPVASASETTGDDNFDRFIGRLRGLVKKLSKERVPPDKRLEKSIRIATLMNAIRKLQVKRDMSGIIASARAIVKRQQEEYDKLVDQIAAVDPKNISTEKLNEISSRILDDKDQVELYSQMYQVFREIFTEGTVEEAELLKHARDTSDDASALVNRYWSMSVNFQKQKMAAHYNITDEFKPEKQLTWYRRMIRSLSQSSTKAGSILWAMVKNINNRLALEFQDRYKSLAAIEKEVDQWLKGKTVKDLYSKIFDIKDDKWNGRIIRKFSPEFYKQLKKAQDDRDLKWVKENIDIEAYNAWFLEEHKRLVENAKTTRVHSDDAKNKEMIIQSLEQFLRTFSLSQGKGVNPNNYRLREFPREDKWLSDQYKELQKPENEPLMKLYERWRKNLEESLESGMISEHTGWSWFPNVRRNLLEKISTAPGSGKLGSFLGNIRIEAEDTTFGKVDPLTGKPVDEIHASFVSDLGEWVKGADGSYFLDYSEKSMDIFKVIALWEREMIKFDLKTESESLARMLAYTEIGRKAYQTTKGGKLDTDEYGRPILVSNESNSKYIKDHIDAVYYNKIMANESDVVIDIPYKSAVEKINKIFGKQILPVPEEDTIKISGIKALGALNRFFITKTLGLNIMTSVAQLFGGTTNAYINQGVFMDKMDLAESELEYISGAFWKGEERKKMAGLLQYFHAFTDDKTSQQIRALSLSNYVKVLSSEHLFVGQRVADNVINSVIAMSFFKNTMVKDGELVNIRQYAKKELGNATKYRGTYEQTKELNDKIEARIDELKKSPDALINKVKIVDDSIEIEGVPRNSDTVVDLRQAILQFTRDALGNTTKEDLSLYKRSIMWQSFFMFKNWIPRMLDVRAQSLKYSPGSQQYEWGRIRMLFRAVHGLGLSKISGLFKTLAGNDKDIIEVAKKSYQQKKEYFASQEEEFHMTEGEFVDMFIKGVRSEFKELGLALAMFGILIAARAYAPDSDEEGYVKGGYKWMVRALDKLQDEVSFFYNPTSFTNIANGSVFPAVNLLVDIEKFLVHGTKNIFFNLTGNDEGAEAAKPAKYLFKIMPITKELISYIAIFNDDFAKDYGIRINSNYGSFK
jgi:hypothetical protein